MVVNLVVPAISCQLRSYILTIRAVVVSGVIFDRRLLTRESKEKLAITLGHLITAMTHLVTITPEEVLCSEVLIWVLWSLLQRLHMAPMLPMLIPQDIRISSRNHQARNRCAILQSASLQHRTLPLNSSPLFLPNLLDRKLAPEICYR